MNAFRVLVAWALVAVAMAAAAQSTQPRGSIPPGTSQDGAKPADGAIKGGSILPGESAGMPDGAKVETDTRCEELTGTLREDCLRQRDAAAGGSTNPLEVPVTEPRTKLPGRAD